MHKGRRHPLGGAHFERKTPRFQMQARMYFTASEVEGEGVVLDLSKGGCRVQCEAELSVGAEIDA